MNKVIEVPEKTKYYSEEKSTQDIYFINYHDDKVTSISEVINKI